MGRIGWLKWYIYIIVGDGGDGSRLVYPYSAGSYSDLLRKEVRLSLLLIDVTQTQIRQLVTLLPWYNSHFSANVCLFSRLVCRHIYISFSRKKSFCKLISLCSYHIYKKSLRDSWFILFSCIMHGRLGVICFRLS